MVSFIKISELIHFLSTTEILINMQKMTSKEIKFNTEVVLYKACLTSVDP